jgi:transcription termination/antitermination protein NusG
MNAMKHLPWFALYVKSRHEKKVACMLQGKGYETFLPKYSHRVKYNKAFDLPLFPGYVFCRIELSNRLPVMATPGIFSIVSNGSEPEPIPEHEVEGIRRMVESEFMAIPWPYVVPGQEVCLESGPLRGVQGVVVDASNGKWLVVSVNLLRRAVAVKVEREFLSVKLSSPSNTKYKISCEVLPSGLSQ